MIDINLCKDITKRIVRDDLGDKLIKAYVDCSGIVPAFIKSVLDAVVGFRIKGFSEHDMVSIASSY